MELTVSDVFRLALYTLAVFRITHLLVHENGPWDIFDWIRAKAGIFIRVKSASTFPYPEGTTVRYEKVVPDTFFAQLLDCPLCLSIWLSIPAFVFWKVDLVLPNAIAILLTISAVQLLLFGWERNE